jgi:hypothetical protein
LQAVIGDNTLNRTQADAEVGLAELLRDDLSRGSRVQEEVAQDLAHRLIGTAIVGFGATFLWLEGWNAALLKSGEQLVIALTAEAVLLGYGDDVLLEALAFHEHEEAASQDVLGRNGQDAGVAGELVGGRVELQGVLHGARLVTGSEKCLTECGTKLSTLTKTTDLPPFLMPHSISRLQSRSNPSLVKHNRESLINRPEKKPVSTVCLS